MCFYQQVGSTRWAGHWETKSDLHRSLPPRTPGSGRHQTQLKLAILVQGLRKLSLSLTGVNRTCLRRTIFTLSTSVLILTASSEQLWKKSHKPVSVSGSSYKDLTLWEDLTSVTWLSHRPHVWLEKAATSRGCGHVGSRLLGKGLQRSTPWNLLSLLPPLGHQSKQVFSLCDLYLNTKGAFPKVVLSNWKDLSLNDNYAQGYFREGNKRVCDF